MRPRLFPQICAERAPSFQLVEWIATTFSVASASVGTELREPLPLGAARRFLRVALLASASETTGNEPSPMLAPATDAEPLAPGPRMPSELHRLDRQRESVAAPSVTVAPGLVTVLTRLVESRFGACVPCKVMPLVMPLLERRREPQLTKESYTYLSISILRVPTEALALPSIPRIGCRRSTEVEPDRDNEQPHDKGPEVTPIMELPEGQVSTLGLPFGRPLTVPPPGVMRRQ